MSTQLVVNNELVHLLNMHLTNDAELDVHISSYSPSTVGVTGSLVLVGQAISESSPHTPEAMRVTVQLYSLPGMIADENIVALSVWVVPAIAGIVLLVSP